jgi:hypothetical protein
MESSAFPTADPIMDWFGIWAGYTNYDDDGRGCAIVQDGPQGVRLAVQPAEKMGPIVTAGTPATPVEKPVPGSIMTILYEEGRYRMWYGGEGGLCYAESTDGFHWERPNLRLVEHEGSRENNILFRGDEFFPESIICDPSAPQAERYKAIGKTGEFRVDGQPISKEEGAKLKVKARELQAKIAELKAKAMDVGDGGVQELQEQIPHYEVESILTGAVSPDGLRWEFLKEPLLRSARGQGLDTSNILGYDAAHGRYLAYLRGHLGRRRCVRLATSRDFREGWEEPRFVLQIDPQDEPDDDIYNPAYCLYPAGKLHLMFPSFYHRISDVLDIQLAVSRDGLNWQRPERKPIVDRQVSGRPIGFGAIYAAPHLVPLGGERWGLPLNASRSNHNQFDWKKRRSVSELPNESWWATWKPHRLVALEAAHEGRVALLERECSGQQLVVNYSTAAGGWLRFELTDVLPNRTEIDALPPMPGYSFADCVPLQGDSLDAAVTWQASSSLAPLKGRQIVVRVQMFRARLFATAI